jgi:hypothetical protein
MVGFGLTTHKLRCTETTLLGQARAKTIFLNSSHGGVVLYSVHLRRMEQMVREIESRQGTGRKFLKGEKKQILIETERS